MAWFGAVLHPCSWYLLIPHLIPAHRGRQRQTKALPARPWDWRRTDYGQQSRDQLQLARRRLGKKNPATARNTWVKINSSERGLYVESEHQGLRWGSGSMEQACQSCPSQSEPPLASCPKPDRDLCSSFYLVDWLAFLSQESCVAQAGPKLTM